MYYIGRVTSFKDNIIICLNSDSNYNFFLGNLIYIYQGEGGSNLSSFKNAVGKGVIFEVSKHELKILLLEGFSWDIKVNYNVYSEGKGVYIPVGYNVLGNIIDPLGNILLTKNLKKNFHKNFYNLEYKLLSVSGSASIIGRKTVCKPLHTGITSVDTLIPVGLGQRQLVIGDKNVGKTSLTVTVIINQKAINNKSKNYILTKSITNKVKEFVPCVYVSVGQKRSEILRIRRVLINADSYWYTSIVFTSADDYPVLQYYSPYTGSTIGEWFMSKGFNSIVIFDDLSKHSVSYRQISLLLRRPPGREAFPGDVFFLHSKLLERGAQLSDNQGEGSMTFLPIIETFSGDVSGYIPTNVISITDGQIFLSVKLFNKGIIPAVDLSLSVSRVGSASQTNTMKQLSKKIKLVLAMYRQFESSAGMNVSETSTSRLYLNKGRLLNTLFTQPLFHTIKFSEKNLFLFAISFGWTDYLELNEAIFYLSTLLDKKFISCIKNTKDKELLIDFISNLDEIESSMVALPYDVLYDILGNTFSAYNNLFKNRILPFLRETDINLISIDSLFN